MFCSKLATNVFAFLCVLSYQMIWSCRDLLLLWVLTFLSFLGLTLVRTYVIIIKTQTDFCFFLNVSLLFEDMVRSLPSKYVCKYLYLSNFIIIISIWNEMLCCNVDLMFFLFIILDIINIYNNIMPLSRVTAVTATVSTFAITAFVMCLRKYQISKLQIKLLIT